MYIPRIIHYCWFGGEMPLEIKKRIKSWRMALPEYEFVLWTEENFDVDYCRYSKEAYVHSKYAFVSDVARLYALSQYGGIYLDTDVDVLTSFDIMLENQGFAGFESSGRVGTCIIGAKKHNVQIERFLEVYRNKPFINADGSLDMTPNTLLFTRLLVNEGLKARNEIQTLNEFTIYPEEWFCPYDPWKNNTNVTKNTVSKHLFHDSWNETISKEMEYIRSIEDAVQDMINSCNDGESLILYGMGVVCKRVIDELRKYDRVSIIGIITTQRDNDWSEFYGVPVLGTVYDVKPVENIGVLICTIPKYHGEIRRILMEQGFNNIYTL